MRAIVFISILLMSGPVLAHGDATWIMLNPDTRYCCGPKDCSAYPESAVERVKGGYLFKPTGEFFSYKKARVSIDDQFWACRPPDGTGDVLCFWAPVGGM